MMRGQEEAPIELLIGVTVLTFVVIIAMYTFSASCSTQQEEKLKASFSKFARDLELVYFGSTGSSQVTRLDFTQIAGCSDYQIDSIRLLKGPSGTCLAQLGRSDCLVLVALARTENPAEPLGVQLIEVLEISSETKVINELKGCNNRDMAEITWNEHNNDQSAERGCWFRPQFYTIRISKTASDTMRIQEVV